MAGPKRVIEAGDYDGGRLDLVLADAVPELSRKRARSLISAGNVFLDGRRCRIASRLVELSARIVVHLALAEEEPSRPLTVIYEDEEMVVIDKPSGVQVNATEMTVTEAVVERFELGTVQLVHRLDRDTSGVMVLARTGAAASALSSAFRDRTVHKLYLAIACGPVEDGVVDAPIGKDRRRPRARRVHSAGKPARTRLTVERSASGLWVLTVEPETGRTHQIRVHLHHRGAPIFGDVLYGGATSVYVGERLVQAERAMLHARALTLPLRSGPRTFEAPVPADMDEVLRLVREATGA